MSKKGANTTADYMDFDSTMSKSIKLLKFDDKKYKIAFLTILGINVGLRVSDLLSLKHKDLQDTTIELIEGKTGKRRIIKLNDNVKSAYDIYRRKLDVVNNDDYLFVSQKGSVFSTRQVNRLLQSTYGTKKKNISSHSLRKTFGRRVWANDGYSERALIMLSKLFNHSSTAITRIYLGIEQEEMNDIYESM